jgi:hypothetical protein
MIRCVFLLLIRLNLPLQYISDQGNKGAFLSPLVSTCLAVHLKKTMHNLKQYGYPVGALAIATAVIRYLHCNSH